MVHHLDIVAIKQCAVTFQKQNSLVNPSSAVYSTFLNFFPLKEEGQSIDKCMGEGGQVMSCKSRLECLVTSVIVTFPAVINLTYSFC